MFQRVLVAVCAILMFATCSAIANDFHKPNVEELTSKNFEEKVCHSPCSRAASSVVFRRFGICCPLACDVQKYSSAGAA